MERSTSTRLWAMISARTAGGWWGELIGSSFTRSLLLRLRHRARTLPSIVGLTLLLGACLATSPAAALPHPSAGSDPRTSPELVHAAPLTLAQSAPAAPKSPAPTSATQTGAAPSSAAKPIPKLSAAQWVVVVNVISAPIILALLWAGNVIRPGSLGEGRGVKGHPWWVWLFAALVVWMSLAVGAGAIAGVPSIVGADTKAIRFAASTQLVGYALGLISAFAMVRLLSTGSAGAGLTLRPKDVPLGLACLALAYPILDLLSRGATLLATKIEGKPPSELAHASLIQMVDSRGNPWVWVVAFNAIVLAPVVEEVIYRGFLQSSILRLTGKAWASIFITAGIFAAAHHGTVPVHVLGVLFALGVAMGLAFERSRSLGVPILMHVGFNAANVALTFWLKG